MKRPPMKQALAGVIGLLAILLAASALLVRFMPERLDTTALAARVLADLRRTTGRTIQLRTTRLTLFPSLTLEADGLTLPNPPGFARPAMLTATHLTLHVALLPLLAHRVVITNVELSGADLALERRADGTNNWTFTPAPAPAPASPPASHPSPSHPDQISLLRLALSGSTLSYTAPGTHAAIPVPLLVLAEVNPSSTIHLDATLILANEPAHLTASLGAQTQLGNPADHTPWPVNATLTAPSGTATFSGTLTTPRTLSGYDLAITAQGPDLPRLLQDLPLPFPLPHLKDLQLQTRLVDRPGGLDIPSLTLTTGASDLSALLPGLTLDNLSIHAPNIDGTTAELNEADATGRFAGQPLSLQARFGPVGRLLHTGTVHARTPIRIDLAAAAAGATLSARGQLQPSGDWSGTALSMQAAIPNLAALAPFARRPLPAWTSLAAQAQLVSSGGTLALHGAHLQSPAIDLAAEATARLGAHPTVTASITLAHMDADTLLAAWPHPPPPTGAPAAPPPATPPPTTLLPFSWLTALDADITIAAGTLTWHAQPAGPLHAHAMLRNAHLTIDPLTATIAGAPVTATLSAESTQTLALALHTQGLDLARLLALLGIPDQAQGTADLALALAGTGATPLSLAATAEGSIGLALTGAALPNHLLASLLGTLVPAASMALHLPQSGQTRLSCLATRLDLTGGIGVLRAFQLDTDRFRLSAAGGIDLGRGTIDLRLRPYIKLGLAGLVLPSHAEGPWLSPRLSLEPANEAATGRSMAQGLLAARGLPSLTDAGDADALLTDADSGTCDRALSLARELPGTPATAAPEQAAAKLPTVRQRALVLLRRLFHR